jgi:ATP-binding cassette subfamily F protein 3
MNLLAAEGLGKHFGPRWCFRDARFTLAAGQRVGLVGANGTGKTTLLRILLGETDHEGVLTRRRDLRVGYLDQNPDFPPGLTVREAALRGAADVAAIERRMADLHEALAAPGLSAGDTRDLLDRLAALERRHEAVGGHTLDHRADAVLDGLGFSAARHDARVEDLSGGERSRLALARLFLHEPDLWLLDEPTNHLDIDGVVFFERALVEAGAAAVIVSHDRRFLDTATTATWLLGGGSLDVLPAPYSLARAMREERLAAARKAYEVQQAYLAKQAEFIRRYGAGQRAREARGRATRLARLERLDRPDDRVRVMTLRFPEARRLGDRVLGVAGLAVAYGDRTLFRDLDFELAPGETLAVMGPNGSGKTSLLRALLGETGHAGEVRWGETVARGVLGQHEVFPDPAATPLGYLRAAAPRRGEESLRDLLGAMRFPGEAADRPVANLSGGEQKRLVMARLLLEGNNVLVLDEPTNHLDVESRETLELALSAFEGSLIVVSHDRHFLDRIADRVLWLEAGAWRITAGGFAEAWAARGAERARREAEARAGRAGGSRRRRPAAGSTGAPRRSRGPYARLKTPELEARIIACEDAIAGLEARYADPETLRDGAKVKALQADLSAERERLAGLEEEYWGREA